MPLNFSAKPALTVVTQPYSLEELGVRDFISLVNGSSSVFINQGQGLIGFGEETRLETTGLNRVEGLNAAWKELVQNSQIEDELCLPGTGLIAFGAIAFAAESAAKSVLIVPKVVVGLSGAKLWITTINTSFEAAIELIKRAPGDLRTIRFDSGNINPDQFKLNIDHALMEIAKQNIEKVVLARDLLGEIPSEFDYSLAVQSLANKFDTCFTYSVDGLFGASPELLVKVSHSQVSARVLAGTAGRGTDPGVDEAIGVALTSSHKNLEEHRFAVESLVSELQELANQIDVDEKPFSLPLPNLWHLASDVHAVLKAESTSLQVVKALHPSAAVAGTSRIKAQQLIAQLEQTDRGRYAGPVGWIGADGDGVWAIALRGAQVDKASHQIRAFAGCGIVAESDPAAELAETNLKFKPILEALS
jgi:menaquinone-specific isochorismate synthase